MDQQQPRSNFFDLLELDPDKAPPAVIEQALRKKRSQWSKKRTREDQQALEQFNHIKQVMTDPALRAAEAAAWRQQRNEQQQASLADLRGVLDLMSQSGYLVEQDIDMLVERFQGRLTEAEIRAQVRVPVRPNPAAEEQPIPDSLDPSLLHRIRESLATLGKPDLYAFLELAPTSSTAALLAQAERKYTQSNTSAQKNLITKTQAGLAGDCKTIFKSDQQRAAYDASLVDVQFAGLREDIDMVALQGGSGEISPEQADGLVQRAVATYGLNREAATEFIRKYARQQGYALIIVQKEARPGATIETPDGTLVANERELALWCERAWHEAATWLYDRDKLASQVERLWARNRLAESLRAAVTQHKDDKLCGLDAALRAMDPSFPNPEVDVSPMLLDFGEMGLAEVKRQTIHLANRGRGYVVLAIQTEGALVAEHAKTAWLVPSRSEVKLGAGQAEHVLLELHAAKLQQSGTIKKSFTISTTYPRNKISLTLQVRAKVLFRTPDGTTIRDTPHLVAWCLQNWEQAVDWIMRNQSDALPNQVEAAWGNARTAQVLRRVCQEERDGYARLDVALRRLDQKLKQNPPQVDVQPKVLDFGEITIRQNKKLSLTFINRGQVGVSLLLPKISWLVPQEDVKLLPGESKRVTIIAALSQHREKGGSKPQATLHILSTHNGEEEIKLQVEGKASIVSVAPDGTKFSNAVRLVEWCERHWDQAVAWVDSKGDEALLVQAWAIYGVELPGKEANPNACLDSLLAALDPSGYGKARPQVRVEPRQLNYGRLVIEGAKEKRQTIRVRNIGRRWVRANIVRRNLPDCLGFQEKAKGVVSTSDKQIVLKSDEAAVVGVTAKDFGRRDSKGKIEGELRIIEESASERILQKIPVRGYIAELPVLRMLVHMILVIIVGVLAGGLSSSVTMMIVFWISQWIGFLRELTVAQFFGFYFGALMVFGLVTLLSMMDSGSSDNSAGGCGCWAIPVLLGGGIWLGATIGDLIMQQTDSTFPSAPIAAHIWDVVTALTVISAVVGMLIAIIRDIRSRSE